VEGPGPRPGQQKDHRQCRQGRWYPQSKHHEYILSYTIPTLAEWPRYRNDRREAGDEQWHRCDLHTLPTTTYSWLPHGRFRAPKIQKDVFGMDSSSRPSDAPAHRFLAERQVTTSTFWNSLDRFLSQRVTLDYISRSMEFPYFVSSCVQCSGCCAHADAGSEGQLLLIF
jgi:hypothetical protein